MNIAKERVHRIARQTWLMFLFVEGVCLLIAATALADVLFSLGWGYSWKDVLSDLGICAWGVFIYAICRAIFRFTAKQAR